MDLTPGPEVEITDEMIEVYQRAYTRYLLSEAATDETVDRHVAEIMPLVEDRTRVAIAAVAPLIHKAAYRAGREDAARDARTREAHLLEMAWCIIANADPRTLDERDDAWAATARKWRDGYHAWLSDSIAEQGTSSLGRSAGSDPKDTSSGTEVER